MLVGPLRLDFAFVRLRNPNGGAIDATRGEGWNAFPEWLSGYLASGREYPRTEIIPDVGGNVERCRGFFMTIGVNAERGLLAAACICSDFPTETDRLLLSVAANHAAMAFQNACLIHDCRRAEEALRQAHDELETKVIERTGELAHVTRIATLGELAASIAHEVSQPLAAILSNAESSLAALANTNPDLAMARDALDDVVTDGRRAADVIKRIRQLAAKHEPEKVQLDINRVIETVVPLVRNELHRHQALLRLELTAGLPPVHGDRVQLVQVIINLVMNGVEAMAAVRDRPRELVIRSEMPDASRVLVAVQDAGVGLDPSRRDQLFTPFVTTKPGGMGMGLSISRSILERHGGQLWATANATHGATFQFALPAMLLEVGTHARS
jgi:C4-dicarboxylate-specific signal transduction histidine kinase